MTGHEGFKLMRLFLKVNINHKSIMGLFYHTQSTSRGGIPSF